MVLTGKRVVPRAAIRFGALGTNLKNGSPVASINISSFHQTIPNYHAPRFWGLENGGPQMLVGVGNNSQADKNRSLGPCNKWNPILQCFRARQNGILQICDEC